MTEVAERLITVDEFARLAPDPEGGRMELVEGKVVTLPPPDAAHREIASVTFFLLRKFVRRHQLGRLATGAAVSLTPDGLNVRVPGVSLVSAQRSPEEGLQRAGYDQPAPGLCVEVFSKGHTDEAMAERVALYLSAGVRRVWVIRPRLGTVTIHRHGADARLLRVGETLSSDDAGFAVEGLALPVRQLFHS